MNEVKNTKVCLVSISLGKGGAERSVSIHSRMLVKAGFDVTVAILNNEIDYPFEGKLYNLGVFKKPNDHFLNRWVRFRRFRRFLKEQRFDYLIDHRSKNEYFRELFYRKYLYQGLKTIYVTHSSNVGLYLTQFPQRFGKLCNTNVANVGVSEYISEEVLKKYGIEHVKTIPNAFDAQWQEQEATALTDPILNRPYILWYGRMEEGVKDISFLMDAFETSFLWQRGFDLVLMGEGTDKTRLQQRSKGFRSEGNIRFLPFTNTPDSIIKGARCVALTSIFEGFPMVLIEALSLGTPVVSLDIISGPSEVIQQGVNGLLIKERNSDTFAKGLIEMCTNENLYRTCHENAKASVAAYSMNEISKLWKTLLDHE